MNVLVACEFSGVVRREFHRRGHFAVSCDIVPSEEPWHGFNPWHYQGDVIELLAQRARPFYHRLNTIEWDLMIGHPPCTHLAVSGARWFPAKRADGSQQKAIDFFMALAKAPIPKICLENPVSIMSTEWRKPDQIIQPWQFGHGETKATCLWLKDLPPLVPTKIVTGRVARVHRMPPSADRAKERSRTYRGIAEAMAGQWG